MNESKQKTVLLEPGINELEVMVFTVDGHLFGIDVSQVREIMMVEPLVRIQKSNEYVEGIFKPRDEVITVINLPAFLGLAASEKPQRDIFIMSGFNSGEYAFHVHSVVGIVRISCAQMKAPDPVIFAGREEIATGIVEHGDELITIIGLEEIIRNICPEKWSAESSGEKCG